MVPCPSSVFPEKQNWILMFFSQLQESKPLLFFTALPDFSCLSFWDFDRPYIWLFFHVILQSVFALLSENFFCGLALTWQLESSKEWSNVYSSGQTWAKSSREIFLALCTKLVAYCLFKSLCVSISGRRSSGKYGHGYPLGPGGPPVYHVPVLEHDGGYPHTPTKMTG